MRRVRERVRGMGGRGAGQINKHSIPYDIKPLNRIDPTPMEKSTTLREI